MDPVAESLIEAQEKARALFADVVQQGLIAPGKLESELSTDIHHLARDRFGLRRHWHKRIARAGENTMLTYHDEPEDRRTPSLTAGELYDYVVSQAAEAGWEFGAATAGHLIGHFPHERDPNDLSRFSIRHGNATRLREADAAGRPRHWILEIHFIDRQRRIGGFFEELLTLDGPAQN
ncbi:MAG: aminopeptidase [Steroidobacteraceae bacterium]|jgi:hypothetical protein